MISGRSNCLNRVKTSIPRCEATVVKRCRGSATRAFNVNEPMPIHEAPVDGTGRPGRPPSRQTIRSLENTERREAVSDDEAGNHDAHHAHQFDENI